MDAKPHWSRHPVLITALLPFMVMLVFVVMYMGFWGIALLVSSPWTDMPTRVWLLPCLACLGFTIAGGIGIRAFARHDQLTQASPTRHQLGWQVLALTAAVGAVTPAAGLVYASLTTGFHPVGWLVGSLVALSLMTALAIVMRVAQLWWRTKA